MAADILRLVRHIDENTGTYQQNAQGDMGGTEAEWPLSFYTFSSVSFFCHYFIYSIPSPVKWG
jgi:hypothetical protein